MRTLGRIILFIISISLLGTAVAIFKENWEFLSQEGWTDFSTYPTRLTALSAIIGQATNFIFGLIALVGAIRGKMSFKLLIASFLMIADVVWFYYNAYNDGSIGDMKRIIQTAIGFALPIGYFIGSVFIMIGKKD